MKSTIILVVLSSVLAGRALAQEPVSGVELGEISLLGTACASVLKAPEIEDNKLLLPVGLNVKRQASERLKRGTCNMSLPITIAAGHRMIISNTSAQGLVNLKKGGKSTISLELFQAGTTGELLQVSHDATLKKVRKAVDLQLEGDALTTQCGESLILRANMSAILTGTGRSTARMDLIEADIRIEQCE